MKEIVGREIDGYTLKGIKEESMKIINDSHNKNPSTLTNVFIISNSECIYAEEVNIYFYPELIGDLEKPWIRFYALEEPIIDDTKEKLIARLV